MSYIIYFDLTKPVEARRPSSWWRWSWFQPPKKDYEGKLKNWNSSLLEVGFEEKEFDMNGGLVDSSLTEVFFSSTKEIEIKLNNKISGSNLSHSWFDHDHLF